MRLIDADALLADCQLAQKQADKQSREFANAFWSGGSEISTEWWCVEDMIENAPTIKPERKRGKWIHGKELSRLYIGDACVEINYEDFRCSSCNVVVEKPCKPTWNYCPNCGAEMRGEEDVDNE